MVRHTLLAEDAARFTLSADQCYTYGAFPYFADEVKGMFIRIKVSHQPLVYAWARIVRAVTAVDLMAPDMNSSVADCEWKVRILEHPIYQWRNKKFEVFFLCEHPSFSQQETELTFESEGQESSQSSSINSSQQSLRRLMTSFSSLVVNLTQLSRQHKPTQEEVDAYCQQFDNCPVSNNISNSDDSDPNRPLRPMRYIVIFLTPPKVSHHKNENSQHHKPIDTTAVVLTNMLGERATNALHRVTGGPIMDGEMPVDVKECGLLWEAYFSKYVACRPLSIEDTEMIMDANSRMSNVVGNLAMKYAAKSKEAIARQAKLEQLLGVTLPSNDSVDDYLTQPIMATDGAYDMGLSSDAHLFTVEEEDIIRNDEKAFFNYVTTEDRSKNFDALVELSSRNRHYNKEVLSRGDKLFLLKASQGQTRVGNEGSGVLWTVDKKKRMSLAMMDHNADKGKASENNTGKKEGKGEPKGNDYSKPWHDPDYIKAVQRRRTIRDSLRAVFEDNDDRELIDLANATVNSITLESTSDTHGATPAGCVLGGSSSASLLFNSMKGAKNI